MKPHKIIKRFGYMRIFPFHFLFSLEMPRETLFNFLPSRFHSPNHFAAFVCSLSAKGKLCVIIWVKFKIRHYTELYPAVKKARKVWEKQSASLIMQISMEKKALNFHCCQDWSWSCNCIEFSIHTINQLVWLVYSSPTFFLPFPTVFY